MWSFNCRLKLSVHSMFLEKCPKFDWNYLSTPSTFLSTPFICINLDFLMSVYTKRVCCCLGL